MLYANDNILRPGTYVNNKLGSMKVDTSMIKTVEKESLRINVVHNGCYFKLQEITFTTLNNNSDG